MALLNDNYLKLKAGYLFPEIGRRVKAFCDANPAAAARLIRCGIGDVTEPLPAAVVVAMHQAVDEMAVRGTFKGYGPEQGYEWLRGTIAKNDFRDKGMDIADDEIFVSDGSKCDCGAILDILGSKNKIAISDPVYPVYVDTNVMAGHTGDANDAGAYAKLVYLPCKPSNGFIPEPPKKHVDVIYLCSPNNPTGAAATREQLEAWVKYALEHKSVILFDAAYEAYITEPGIPHSIYEIPGARDCAIEFRSFSKNGGFTGTRCAFTVVPKSLNAYTKTGEAKPLHPLWNRRMTTKFNGVSLDSANMHLASLFGVPVVSVWGATHPFAGFFGWAQPTDNAVQIDLYCRPCSVFGNKPCYRGDHACMQQLPEEKIIEKVITVIQ